jgi:hypothetical protein
MKLSTLVTSTLCVSLASAASCKVGYNYCASSLLGRGENLPHPDFGLLKANIICSKQIGYTTSELQALVDTLPDRLKLPKDPDYFLFKCVRGRVYDVPALDKTCLQGCEDLGQGKSDRCKE